MAKRPPGFIPEAERERPGKPQVRLFRGDEMSTGQSSSLLKRVGKVIGSARPATSGRPAPSSEDPTKREITRRAMQAELAARQATKPGSAAAKTKPVPQGKASDTFVRKKMRQAEKNLPAWDPDDETSG